MLKNMHESRYGKEKRASWLSVTRLMKLKKYGTAHKRYAAITTYIIRYAIALPHTMRITPR